jgi:hypothetical protein
MHRLTALGRASFEPAWGQRERLDQRRPTFAGVGRRVSHTLKRAVAGYTVEVFP